MVQLRFFILHSSFAFHGLQYLRDTLVTSISDLSESNAFVIQSLNNESLYIPLGFNKRDLGNPLIHFQKLKTKSEEPC